MINNILTISNKTNYINNANIYVDGNSISAGQGSTSNNSYPEQLERLYPLFKNYFSSINNYAVGGQTTLDMISDAPTQIDPLFISGKNNILLAWEIRNDMVVNYPTPQEAVNNFKTYCLGRKTANPDLKIITATVLPSWYNSYSGDTTATGYNLLKSNTLIVNQLLREQYTSFCDYLIDFETITDFGLYPANEQDGYVFNTSIRPIENFYYTDGTHPNNNGYRIIANEFNKAIYRLK